MNSSTGRGSATEYDVFLCHNSDDKPEVRQVYEALKARGLKPWIDEEKLRPGGRWRKEIETALNNLWKVVEWREGQGVDVKNVPRFPIVGEE